MKLFERGRIGRLLLKNRIVLPAMGVALGEPVEEWYLSQRAIDFYVARARGGVGMITTTFMRPNRRLEGEARGKSAYSFHDPVINSSRCIRWLNDLAEAVHDYRAKVCVQLTPGFGRMQSPSPDLPDGGTFSASAVPNFWDPNVICRELTIVEIEQLIEDFEFSSKVVKAAGIDAIEIHAHHGYLADQFMTALWNKRSDKYGGDLDGRLRFPLELIAAVKRGAGADFPVIFKYGLTHYLDGGREVEEGLEIARRLEAVGVDALRINAGTAETANFTCLPTTQPAGLLVGFAEMTKKVVNIPVIAGGKLGYPELAERVLQEGKADFIVLGRSLLADPEWPNKVKEGRLEDIVPCIGCNEACHRREAENKHISCAVNPACGLERESIISPAEKGKKVLIIGGGPAGMEAARVATLRGHKVTIWEKGNTLGGNLIAAAIPNFKQDYKLLLDYLTNQIRKLEITVEFGVEATPESIRKMTPDVVFIATGAKPMVPKVQGVKQGMETGKVVTSADVLLGKKEIGESVVIVGAGMVGCEVGLWLAREGKKVTIVECYEALRDVYWINAKDIKEKLEEVNAKILNYTNVLEVTGEGLVIANAQGEKSILRADTIVLAVGLEPDRGLMEALQDELPEVYDIGDCVESRRVIEAIWEGFRTARLI